MNETIEVLSYEVIELNKSIARYRNIIRYLETENKRLKAHIEDLKEQIGDVPFCEQVDVWLHGGAPKECKECTEGKYAELAGEFEDDEDCEQCAANFLKVLNGLRNENKEYREQVKACAEELAACADAMLNS